MNAKVWNIFGVEKGRECKLNKKGAVKVLVYSSRKQTTTFTAPFLFGWPSI